MAQQNESTFHEVLEEKPQAEKDGNIKTNANTEETSTLDNDDYLSTSVGKDDLSISSNEKGSPETDEINSSDQQNVTPKRCLLESPVNVILDENNKGEPTFSDETQSESSDDFYRNQDSLANQQIRLDEAVELALKEIKARNFELENGCEELKLRLSSQELDFKKRELAMREEYLCNVEKLSKECHTLRKEKESIVIRYANSEKEVIMEKKAQHELEKRMKDLNKDRENLLLKIKNLSSENSRLSSTCESRSTETTKLQKNLEKISADVTSKDVRIKWLQNKLKTETTAHEETQLKLDQTVHRLNEMKEEAEQVRKDCQEMIKCYQEAEEIKSVKLGSQLKQKLSELEVQKQEKSSQEQVHELLRLELDSLKKRQRLTIEENNSLTLKIQSLEKNRLEYEQNLSKFKDNQNLLKQEIVDLKAHLAEMETLQLQLEREKEKSAASLCEIERLRLTNAELQSDMNACHAKEGELLKFTEGVTDTNVKLQSAHSLLEIKAQALEDELTEVKKTLVDLQQKHLQLESDFETTKRVHENEVQLLARKLAEKTKQVEKLNTKLDEAENENRVLKRRHIASIRELSRELHECKRRLDKYDSSNGIHTENVSLGSRSSSMASLDVMNSNESKVNGISTPPVPTSSQRVNSPISPPPNTSPDIPGIDKEMLIERIIKLQKTLARKNDKIDFLEDHIVQLVKEMRKKPKVSDFKPS